MKSLMIFLQSMKLLYSRCICNSDLVFRSTSIRVSISTIILLLTRRSSCSSSGGGIALVNAPVTCLQNLKQQIRFFLPRNSHINSIIVGNSKAIQNMRKLVDKLGYTHIKLFPCDQLFYFFQMCFL